MKELIKELRKLLKNYTEFYNIECFDDLVTLYIQNINSKLINEILILSNNLSYEFEIYDAKVGIQIEFKTKL